MASPSISRTCAQAVRLPSRIFPLSVYREIARRDFHIPAPLYLDFLAPSWQRRSYIAPPQRAGQSIRSSTTGFSSSHVRQRIPNQRHNFSTTSAVRASAKVILNPKTDSSGNIMTITITPRAAHRLQNIASNDSNPNTALRVSVESGGCHGFQYLMSLIDTTKDVDKDEDVMFENEERVGGQEAEGDYKAKVVMDEPSLELLNGSSVDYTMELIGSQFKVTGIPGAKSSCGCGTSFDIAV